MAKKNIKNAQATENTVDVIKEAGIMAENTINVTAEAIEEVAVPAGPKQMLLVTASRGKNTKLAWNVIEVNDDDATQSSFPTSTWTSLLSVSKRRRQCAVQQAPCPTCTLVTVR